MSTENQSRPNNSPSAQDGQRRNSSRRRRGGRGRSGGSETKRSESANNSQSPAKGGASNNSRRPRRRKQSGNSPRRPSVKLTGFDLVAANYEKVLQEHLEARKKYFELYYRAQPAQRDKLERLFYQSQSKLYSFEETVPSEYLEEFKQKVDGLTPDLVYSERREISPEGELEIRSEAEIEDPHYLESQKQADFKEDTEESMGTLDDYKSYKGLF